MISALFGLEALMHLLSVSIFYTPLLEVFAHSIGVLGVLERVIDKRLPYHKSPPRNRDLSRIKILISNICNLHIFFIAQTSCLVSTFLSRFGDTNPDPDLT